MSFKDRKAKEAYDELEWLSSPDAERLSDGERINRFIKAWSKFKKFDGVDTDYDDAEHVEEAETSINPYLPNEYIRAMQPVLQFYSHGVPTNYNTETSLERVYRVIKEIADKKG